METSYIKSESGFNILLDTNNLQSVCAIVWINCGVANETRNINGISHFLEHMLFKGTENRDYKQIALEIENIGGKMNAYTSRERTAYYVQTIKENIDKSFEILSDMVLNPSFPVKEIEKEKGVVIQEIMKYDDMPDELIYDLFYEKVYKDQPIGYNILGSKKNVNGFTQETLKEYWANQYTKENLVIGFSGNIKKAEAIKLVDKWFKKSNLASVKKSKEWQKSDAVFNQGKHHFTKKSEQTHLVIAYDGIKRDHKLYTASNLLSTILGDGMSSQLFNEIREKQGLAYTVYSFTDIFKKGALFGAYAAGSKEKSEQMKNSMLKIINQKKYTDNELKKAKNMTISSLKMMQDNSFAKLSAKASQMFYNGSILSFDKIIDKVQKVTLKDVADVADKIFSAENVIATLGAKK